MGEWAYNPLTGNLDRIGDGGGEQPVVFINGNEGSATGEEINLETPTSETETQGTARFIAADDTIQLLFTSDDGLHNTSLGLQSAPELAPTGSGNTTFGYLAGSSITSGSGNTFFGSEAGSNVAERSSNTHFGARGQMENIGLNNTSVGYEALNQLANGNYNTVIGYRAGLPYDATESSNILIGSAGLFPEDTFGESNDQNTLRIGRATGVNTGMITQAFICGIHNNTFVGKIVTVDPATNKIGALPQPSAFRAFVYDSIPNVTGDSTSYDLTFTAVNQTTDNSFNGGTGFYTAPRAGFYIFTCSIWLYNVTPADHNTVYAQLRFNSGAVYAFQAADMSLDGITDEAGMCLLTYSMVTNLEISDTVNVQVSVSGVSKTVGIQGQTNVGPIQFGTSFTGAELRIQI